MYFFFRSFLLLQKRTKKAGPQSKYNAISAFALIEQLCYCCARHLDLDQQLYALVSQEKLDDLRQMMLNRIPNALHYSSTKAQSRLPRKWP